MRRHLAPVVCLLAAALTAGATGVLAPFARPLDPPSSGGYELVDRALAKLAVHRRVLVVGAHPDDEDTTLLTLVARELGGEAAYLSLSRGEGGQNLIGPELGPALGLLRTRELLAAREVDGARQFFTRAYDFGYTRSLTETHGWWPREVLLEDAVRVVRRFRPQVVVSVFPPDERAGHGQHQAAGVVAGEAYRAAGEATAFPGQAAEGLVPWAPEALYRNTWWRGAEETTVRLPAGVLDPLTGRSIFQLAMASRSRHRSQDMGMLQPLGPQEARLGWEAGGGGPGGDDLFAGIDTRLAALAALLPAGPAREAVAGRLARVEAAAVATRAGLSAADLRRAVAPLAAILGLLRDARAEAAASPHATALIGEKVALAERALAAAAGVAVDAVADRRQVAPGDAWRVEAMATLPAGSDPPVELTAVEVVSPDGRALEVTAVEPTEPAAGASRFVPASDPERGFHVRSFTARVPPGSPPTVPYFLRRPLAGALYDWSDAPPEVRGEPFEPPPLAVRFHLRVAGVETAVEREVAWRFRDQAVGEVREPVRVVPPVEVAVAPDLLVWPVGRARPRELSLTLTSHAAAPLAGRIEVAVPAGWPVVAPLPFALAPAADDGDGTVLRVPAAPPAGVAPGSYRIGVTVVVEEPPAAAGRWELAVPLVAYPHIRATPHPEPAVATIAAADVALPPLDRVGYVRGASDRVPELLAEVGVPLQVLEPAALAATDFAAYDAIVIGSRAYETEPALARANPRLLDYVRRGGLLVVQYQQYAFVEGGFAPLPLTIGRPHGRVTDEVAPVTLLAPAHPVFHVPNEIAARDWEGWVQERGLYFPATWDEGYLPLLAMADPGQPDQRGALLVARLGEGAYVYTGLAFFRQLPAGVPGAYRLFANLLALGAAPEAD